jgi:hypothetical protein
MLCSKLPSRQDVEQPVLLNHSPPIVAKFIAESLWCSPVGVILVMIAIMIVIHLLCPLLRLVIGPLAVEEVFALGLGELVNFSTSKAS